MNPHIVADGKRRLDRDPKNQARLQELRDSVTARYATELANAGFLQRFILQRHIAAEVRRERRKLAPSPGSLYCNRMADS
ncbi:MAG: hypothetical protein IAE97_01935 [Chthoniobacterales bacterium]|nr:hypothetical protein [Chthoniobacterales bacterium]